METQTWIHKADGSIEPKNKHPSMDTPVGTRVRLITDWTNEQAPSAHIVGLRVGDTGVISFKQSGRLRIKWDKVSKDLCVSNGINQNGLSTSGEILEIIE